jgi:8-oxo-dGTP diphosphatase
MTGDVRLLLVAAAVLVDGDGRVLLAQRPQGKNLAGLWEFPGGKIEAGERPEAALVRELNEELGIQVETGDLKPIGFASHAYEDFHLLMPLWLASVWQGTPKPREGQALVWSDVAALSDYPMPPADVPLVETLKALKRQGALQ